ncbi:MAG: polymer-forming cytoskeletal protein [Pseudomonadota bacterium]
MFNKKNDAMSYFANEEETQVASSTEFKTPETTIQTPKADTSTASASNSIIDEWLTMRGDLESEGDILVKGKIHGNIRCKLLVIDTNAMVEGGMIAEEVVVRGSISGEVRANRVRLEESAIVDSEIFHRSFSVAEGAQIKGALHYQDNPMTEANIAEASSDSGKKAAKKSNGANPTEAAPNSEPASANGAATAH